MANTIIITTRGTYPHEVSAGLLESLAAAIQRHMEGYGLRDVTVRVEAKAEEAGGFGVFSANYEADAAGECPNCANPPHSGPCQRKRAKTAEGASTQPGPGESASTGSPKTDVPE